MSLSAQSMCVYDSPYGDAVTVLKGICTALMISTQELRTGTVLPQCHSVEVVSNFVLLAPHEA